MWSDRCTFSKENGKDIVFIRGVGGRGPPFNSYQTQTSLVSEKKKLYCWVLIKRLRNNVGTLDP